MSVLSWMVVVFGERGFFHLRSTCIGNTGLDNITQDSLLKDFSESLLAFMLCDYLRVIQDAMVSKVICPQDFFFPIFMEYLMPPFRVFLEKAFTGYESAPLSPSSASSKVALQPGGIQVAKYRCTNPPWV